MKRTTYIILGVLLALLAGMSATIIYWGTHSGDASDRIIRLEGEESVRSLPTCKVVRFLMDRSLYQHDGSDDFTYYFTLNDARLKVVSADTASGSFSYASDMEEFMDFRTHGDTLDIVFRFPPEKLQKRMPQGKIAPYFSLHTAPFRLRLPESVECLTGGDVLRLVELEDVRRDSLAIDFTEGPATVFVRNSHLRALSASSRQLLLVSGSVEHLHLSLDELYSFEVETDSFRIDTEYLSGFRKADFRANPQECRRILWHPLSKDAKLNLEMKHRGEILLRE